MALRTATKVVVGLFAAMIVFVGAGVGYSMWALSGEPGDGQEVTVTIPEGATAATVAQMLEREGVVRSSLAFRMKARSSNLDRNLRAGEYVFERGMSVDEAIEVLLEGPRPPEGLRVTVPEGLTVEEILGRLADGTDHSVDDYRQVLESGALRLPEWVPDPDSRGAEVPQPYEGLLFPETYEFRRDANAQQILQRMVDQLAAVVEAVPADLVAAADDRGLDRYQVLVLASLVEEEAKVAEERRTIAGVITNRLRDQRALQIDATVLYAQDRKGRVLAEDTHIDSPYNTYMQRGLPPTPISAPGKAAIRAAFDPEEHDYYFYVKVDEEGHHAFAETYEEHRRNVERFRELQQRARQEQTASPSPAATSSPG